MTGLPMAWLARGFNHGYFDIKGNIVVLFYSVFPYISRVSMKALISSGTTLFPPHPVVKGRAMKAKMKR